jgi:hypothetical protein
MPAGDIVRLRTRGTQLTSRVEFGVHIRYVSQSSRADDLAASWVATIMPLVIAATSAGVNWDEIVVSDTSPTGQESFTLPLTQPSPGAFPGDYLPPQNAAVIGLRTGVKGGRRRGRIYLPGLVEIGNANGKLTGSQLTAVQGLAQGIINTFGPSGVETDYRLVVYSPEKLTFPTPRPPKPRPGRVITDVQSSVIDPNIRTQRRRSIGVGA